MPSLSKTRCEPYVGFAWLGWRNKTGRRRRYFYINTFSACIFARICAPICARRSICICPLVFQGVLVFIYKVSCRQYVAYNIHLCYNFKDTHLISLHNLYIMYLQKQTSPPSEICAPVTFKSLQMFRCRVLNFRTP